MEDSQRNEWKLRLKWTLLVLLVFVLFGIIGSIFYQYTAGKYTPTDLYRDLGFYDANANVNGSVNVNTPTNVNN
jgi:hypothetical protein